MTERVRLGLATLLVAGLGVGFSVAFLSTPTAGGQVEAARAAMSAWGLFAGNGDLDAVAPWFAAEGPQFRQLASETGTIRPGPSYTFNLVEPTLIEPDLVRGTVVVARLGEPSQTYFWDIHLIQEDGLWKVWMVSTSPKTEA